MKALLKQFGIDRIVGLDWETYYDDQYSLRKLAQTEYITSPLFESQLVAVQLHSWKKARVFDTKTFKLWAAGIDWSRTGMLAHHTHFDGLIASHRFKIKPKAYFDTLSMARLLMPVHVGGSLHKVAQAFGFAGKQFGQALADVKGKRFKEFSKDQLKFLKTYAGDDIEQTWGIFNKMLPYVPYEELRLIDLTVKMYAQPTLLLDGAALQDLADSEVARKNKILEQYDKKTLMSNDKFAVLLRNALEAGNRSSTPLPMKVSKTTGKETFAFSKQDQAFKDLLEHDDDEVATLVAARLGMKSTIVETRAQRMADRASLGAQPIYLNYWGAKTGRWSGGDKSNWQNLGRGSAMRTAIHAPPGHSLIIADLAQIEARINAWFAGQQNIIDAFANKIDVYKLAAAMIYNKPLESITKDERFLGKCCVLALGYGAGWSRFAEMLRIGALGPPIPITDSLARDIHTAWRQANPYIVAGWKRANNNAKSAFMGRQRIEDGVLTYEGTKDKGFTHGPGGVGIRYDGLAFDEEGMSYVTKSRQLVRGGVTELRQRLYGGLLCVDGAADVLSTRGWIRLDSVREDDLLHDGVEFVSHGGLVAKGTQNSVIIDGVAMTPDHEVLTDAGWQAALEKPRPYRPDLRCVDGALTRWVGRQENALDIPVSVREDNDQGRVGGHQSGDERADSELRMLDRASDVQASHARNEQTPGVRRMAGNDRPLQAAHASSLEKLRRAGYQRMQTLVNFIRSLLGGHGALVPVGAYAGAQEQQPQLHARQLLLGDAVAATAQQAHKPEDRRGCNIESHGHRYNDTVLPDQPRLAESEAHQAATLEIARPVFDVLNCGPRMRFVVAGHAGPFIVHNCENNTQFLARQVVAHQMIHIADEIKNWRQAMTTHDEIVGVVPTRSANKVLKAVTRIMSTPPDWAPDLPLAVDAHISSRYDK